MIGLDNGIFVRSKRRLKLPDFCDDRMVYDREVDSTDGAEIAYDHYVLYWRKWWSFRNDVMAECGFADGDYEIALDLPTLQTIADIHHYYNNEEVWNEAESIWSWKDVKDNFQKQEKVFQWLLRFKQLHPEVEIFFYDSY